eukprot:TRINITY_DN621_c1_g1_i2.p1 TRINITY_DN621_c1_g1~~TRINITY_DN621_c1_g1_i2.p1  ORF type:complete len:205 (+),score=3.84 TRINITY_DN621_c1_g1_i2:687-1301(+)
MSAQNPSGDRKIVRHKKLLEFMHSKFFDMVEATAGNVLEIARQRFAKCGRGCLAFMGSTVEETLTSLDRGVALQYIPVSDSLSAEEFFSDYPAVFEQIMSYDPTTQFVAMIAFAFDQTDCVYNSTIITAQASFSKDLASLVQEEETREKVLPLTAIVACKTCGKGGKLKRCGRCRLVQYCSAECQKQNWKSHKEFCLVCDSFRS